MARIAYRFVPCDQDGKPRENSQYTLIPEKDEPIEVGSVIGANLLGYCEWEVVEIRPLSELLGGTAETKGAPIPLGGMLVCRGLRRQS